MRDRNWITFGTPPIKSSRKDMRDGTEISLPFFL